MIEAYVILARRIRDELNNLEKILDRARLGMDTAYDRPEVQDFLIDSAALNLHDFYAGIERVFHLSLQV
jgi:hypothetical protein